MVAGPARKILDLSVEVPPDPVAAETPMPESRTEGPSRLRRLTFDTLTPRRFSALRSSVVHLLKVVLPIAALIIAASVLLWPHLQPEERRIKLKPVAVGIEDIENLRMLQPRYMGVDEKNQPYTLTAEQATQDSGDSDMTELSRPKADITLENGTWVALTAEQGQYNKSTRRLELLGDVNVFHDEGYELKTARALVEFDRGVASGSAKVAGQGPNSELEGEGFRLLDRGARIIVTGKSRLVLYPGAKPAARKVER
ncbi:MAG TPA: LPS export ABC transporter periplasmic protein LptC [Alphaproteobacteria bacterium]|jgi:lipopolysaccharide export system protein LptC|nr:LPS export ABC transporter periplasmic protein LptC [Alphaproteobacteria bacterium]